MMTPVRGQKHGVTAPIDWAKCGTVANARRHYRLGEKPCAACRKAVSRDRTKKKLS